jgi:hypothetical protein
MGFEGKTVLGEAKSFVLHLHLFSESQNQWRSTNHAVCIEKRFNTTLLQPVITTEGTIST